jgi:hypothetical protein
MREGKNFEIFCSFYWKTALYWTGESNFSIVNLKVLSSGMDPAEIRLM